MDRAKYNQCLRPYITGSKPKDQRTMDFCVGAKICSGKAKDREEAEQLCSLPKEPKQAGRKKQRSPQSCEKEMIQLSQCMMDYFEANNIYKQILNVNSVGMAIANALLECQCQSRK